MNRPWRKWLIEEGGISALLSAVFGIVLGIALFLLYLRFVPPELRPVSAGSVSVVSQAARMEAQTDTLKREVRIEEIVQRMPYADSLQHDLPKLCLYVFDHFSDLEQDVDGSVRLFESTDAKSEPWLVSLYITTARFLRYDCHSFFHNMKMSDTTSMGERAYNVHLRIGRLVHVLDR